MIPALPSSGGRGGISLSRSGTSGSTGGAGFTVVSVGAVSETPSDLLKTRSTRAKNLEGN